MYISTEGIDRSGKDSFQLAFDKRSKWKTCNMMRGPAGCLFYDKFYNRETEERRNAAFSMAESIKATKHLILFFYANPEDIERRLKEEGLTVKDTFGNLSIKDTISQYKECLYSLYGKEEVLEINSSLMTIDQEVDLVSNRVEEIEKMDMQLVVDDSIKDIKSPNSGKFSYIQYRPFRSLYTYIDFKDKTFDINIDKLYYEMLDTALTHKIHLYDLNWVNKRNVFYTSNDCIAFVQIMINEDTNTVKYIVNQRSCDIEKHHFNDIVFFWWWHNKSKLKDMRFILDYTCSYPHRYIKNK